MSKYQQTKRSSPKDQYYRLNGNVFGKRTIEKKSKARIKKLR